MRQQQHLFPTSHYVLLRHARAGGEARRRGGYRRWQLLIQGVELEVEEHFGAIGAQHGLACEDIHIVREKRVGSSIVNTGARESAGEPVKLYDAAAVLRKTAWAEKRRTSARTATGEKSNRAEVIGVVSRDCPLGG
jgi:hypothetical protein